MVMELSSDCLKSMCTVAVGAGAVALGLSGATVLAGSVELLSGAGHLALNLGEGQQAKLEKLESRVRKSLERDYKGWLKGEFGDDWAAKADVKAALIQLDDAIHRARPTVQDMVAAGHKADILVASLMDRLPPSGLFRTNALAAQVFASMITGLHGLARSDDDLQPFFNSISWERAFSEFTEIKQQISASEQRVLDALHTKHGIPIESLERLFHAAQHEFPSGNYIEAVERAVAAIVARDDKPVDVGNLGPDLQTLIAQARAAFRETADAQAATQRFDAVFADADGQMLRAAALASERAAMFATVFRFDDAIRSYELAARYNPDDPWPWFHIGDIRKSRGNLALAKQAHENGKAVAERTGNERDLSVSHNKIGDVEQAQGNLAAALEAYQASLATRKTLAARDPANTDWQRDLSVSHNRIGDVERAQGNLAAALKAIQAGLTIAETLAARDPANTQWQRDLSFSHDRIGDVEQAQGNLATALTAYQASLAIAETLAAHDPANTEWQRDLAVSHNKIGDVELAQGNLAAALKAYQAGLAIAETLAARDPANTGWQRDLSVSHEKIGAVEQAQGNLAAALKAFQASLAIRETLAARDPANTEWQRDLSVSHEKIGNVELAQGNLAAALKAHRASLAIAETLAARDPSNTEWQRDLIISNVKLAEAGDDPGMRYRTALGIAENLQTTGRLQPVDHWMVDELKKRLATAEKP